MIQSLTCQALTKEEDWRRKVAPLRRQNMLVFGHCAEPISIALGYHMKRRDFISLIGGAAVAGPLAARAQEPGRLRRIGVLLALVDSDPEGPPRIAAFQRELESLGWTAGRNIQIEYRWARGDAERFRTHAAELVAMSPDVVVAHTSPSATALARETRTIPIVFAMVSDPVGSG